MNETKEKAAPGVEGEQIDDGMKEFTLARDNDRDVSFRGEHIGSGCSDEQTGRWTSVDIYRTKGGKYVVEIIGHTRWQGEHNCQSVNIVDTPEHVVGTLMDEYDGFLSWVAKAALDKAGIPHAERIE